MTGGPMDHLEAYYTQYDEEGRLTSIRTGDPGGEPEYVTEITYDGEGRLLSSVYTCAAYQEADSFAYDLTAMKLTHTRTTTYRESVS